MPRHRRKAAGKNYVLPQCSGIATRLEEKDRAMSAPTAPMTAVSSMMFIGSVASLLLGIIFFMRAFTLAQTKLPGIFKEGF
jgi:hypothetical protein